jgi:hypothetical protein
MNGKQPSEPNLTLQDSKKKGVNCKKKNKKNKKERETVTNTRVWYTEGKHIFVF